MPPMWGCGKMRNAEYRCGMEIGLGLGVRASSVYGLARAWIGVSIRILFCSSIAQFLAILCIPHLRRCRMGIVLRLRLRSVVRFRVMVRVSFRV